jgi:CelD/BcsL family acetyltransferase involved in cellulose biosynthesis
VTEVEVPAARADAAQRLRADVAAGRRRVHAALPELEELGRALGVPAPARTSWMRAQLECHAGPEPWAVRVRAADGALVAAAIVLEEEAATPQLAGGGEGHRGAVIAVDEAAAEALGHGTAAEADRRGHDGVAGLVRDDLVARAFAASAGIDAAAAPGVPALVPEDGPDLAAYLSHGMLRTLRKARNRLTADERKAEVVVTRRGAEIVRSLPAMEAAYRSRDERHGVASALDDEQGHAAWRARIRRLLEHRCLELSLLLVDGELAAYVLGIDDGAWYRVLDGRIDDGFARYAPGRVLEAAVLERALAAGVTGVDWMTSVAPETLLASNSVQPVLALTPRR